MIVPLAIRRLDHAPHHPGHATTPRKHLDEHDITGRLPLDVRAQAGRLRHAVKLAGHYWGWTTDLVRRISREHRNPRWSGPGRLVQVALAAGLTFELAWLEYPATLGRERRLKRQGSAYRRCPLCRGTGGPLDPVAAAAAVLQAGGAR